jgi:hypothetical protein
MRKLALLAAASIGLLAATAGAKAFDFPIWTDWGPGLGPWHYDPGQPKGTQSIVAGWGDDLSQGQQRYWGGPFFVDRRGAKPPYQSYPGCQTVVVDNPNGSVRRVRDCR